MKNWPTIQQIQAKCSQNFQKTDSKIHINFLNKRNSSKIQYDKRKKQQLQILALLQKQLLQKFNQKEEGKTKIAQNIIQQYNQNFVSATRKIPNKILNQHFQQSSSEYEYPEQNVEPIYRTQFKNKQKLTQKELKESNNVHLLQNLIQQQQQDEQWINLQEKLGKQKQVKMLSKRQSLLKKKLIKNQQNQNQKQIIRHQTQQPLSPPSSVQILKNQRILSKTKQNKLINIEEQLSFKKSKDKKNLQKNQKFSEKYPSLSQYSQYELSSEVLLKINSKKRKKLSQIHQKQNIIKQQVPQSQNIKFKQGKIIQKNQPGSIQRQQETVSYEQEQIISLSQPVPQQIQKKDNKNCWIVNIKNNLNQIYKHKQKQSETFQAQPNIRSRRKLPKEKLKLLRQRQFQNETKFNKGKSVAKILIEEQCAFSTVKKKIKDGTIPLNLKSVNVTEFNNIATYVCRRTVREIQHQLVEKCKLNINPIICRQFVFIRTPLIRARQFMPQDHLRTFFCLVGYTYQLNLTLPPQKDIIALYQFLLIKLQQQIALKKSQQTFSNYPLIHAKDTKKQSQVQLNKQFSQSPILKNNIKGNKQYYTSNNQLRSLEAKSKQIMKKRSQSIFMDTFRQNYSNSIKDKNQSSIDQDQKLLKQLQQFVKNQSEKSIK